jgi:hypothetical protein
MRARRLAGLALSLAGSSLFGYALVRALRIVLGG